MYRRLSAALCAATFFLAACAHFDHHDDTLPSEIVEVLPQILSETATEREARNHDETQIIVGKILIINRTVLHDDDFFAPLLNNVHFVTQKDVIRDELFFNEGETIPRYRLYDAERYVRLLDPIKFARIIEHYNIETKKTDLTVITRDKYTPKFNSGANGSGGYTSFGLSVTEPSLFGRLYSVGGAYSRENFRDWVTLSAGKARINGSRWEVAGATTIGYANSIYNYQDARFRATLPFLRNGQRHGFNIAGAIVNGINYDYLGGSVRQGLDSATGQPFNLIYHTKIENFSLQYLYAIGVNDRIEFGPGFLHNIRQDYYINPNDQYSLSDTTPLNVSQAARAYYQPQQYSTNALTFTVNTRNGNFVPMRNFQRYIFTEDQFEGLRSSFSIIHANPAFGLSDYYTTPSLTVAYQKNSHNQKFRLDVSASRIATLWHSGTPYPTDDLWSGDAKGYFFTLFGTLALREYVAQGYHLTQNLRSGFATQSSIAGQTGLLGPSGIASQITRGFSYGSLYPSAGNLTSLEYRSPALKLPYLLVAGVLFFDYAGIGDTLSTLTYYSIAGFGVRSMWHEFDNNVFRIDFGFNLNAPQANFLNAIQFGISQTF